MERKKEGVERRIYLTRGYGFSAARSHHESTLENTGVIMAMEGSEYFFRDTILDDALATVGLADTIEESEYCLPDPDSPPRPNSR
ncbi:unnamed protein product [Toxocara canis]|uniref:Transposase n=1 Tax=Toxocara canis TaxID=6265 RepID=A0A183UG36_TOXCA|nr:unnamed protein product [Toxocara canis]